jgi:hypothetical protein
MPPTAASEMPSTAISETPHTATSESRSLIEKILPEDAPLDEEILSILGEDWNKKVYAEAIHKDIATRWTHIVTNGLEKDKKAEML